MADPKPNTPPKPATPAKGPTTGGQASPTARAAAPVKGPTTPSKRAEVKATVKQQATKLRGQATDKAQTLASQGKAKATEQLDGVSKMIGDAAAQVDDKLGAQYGDYARSAASAVQGFADTLRGKEVDDLVADAREFVRKSPALAIGAAAAVGFVLARLARAGYDATDDKKA